MTGSSFPPVGIAIYLRCLVTEEDQVVMNTVRAACLFNEDQHALNWASVLHHEAFLRIREERKAEVRDLTEKNDTYKLLSEKLQVRQRLEQIGDLQEQTDAIRAEAEEERTSVQAKKIEELQFRLANLANELEVAKSEVAAANTKANATATQYKVDVGAIQALYKIMVDHAKWQARKDALEEVHAQGFDIQAALENAKVEEATARKLAFPEEDSDSLSESEGGEDLEDADAAYDEDLST
ncbi:PREDICTED: uncharacterized protein LOC109205408 [Nicotiana attenuata]|uniref:uncharacterized protein LOC109205408 n=1 Tax=Nicotiana attenuata TaxID=49451 RepID=UPI000905994E|nr:PREDICTED: uncharacterized protein LOC109205408 [Nicotiana attenuata]